ncbi:MAG: YsnF/AvaK domain-containing protein [Sphingomicrobium sp.]
MSRTVTAMYDSRSEAESARERLSSTANISDVRILDHDSTSGSSGESEHRNWFEKLFMPDEDRETYGEGMRRGHFMLCAQIDDDEDADRIVDLLEETNAMDVDASSQSWRNEGWEPQSRQSIGSSGFGTEDRYAETGDRTVEEERIPIVEEQLHVGKREVERGGARVRSYVRETPVNEQVHLREENVSIERRPVNETLSTNDLDSRDLLQDREIDMRATGEEAVVGKEAHVNEELVVRKTESERTENVQDTVRHTEVDVDGDADRTGSAFGFDRDSDRSSLDERSDETLSSSDLQDDSFGRR